MLLHRTVKYRDSKQVFFRRVFGVVRAELVDLDAQFRSVWILTKRNGETVHVPSEGGVIHFGRRVPVIFE
jgi:hypothetical protein